MKTNSTIGSVINDGGSVTFTVVGAGEFTFDPAKASEAVRARATLHGFIQRISDGAAMSRDSTTGLPATPGAKMARMKAIADHYESGTADWALRVAATGGGKKGFDVGAVIMALIRAGFADNVDGANAVLEGTATRKGIDRAAAAKLWAQTPEIIEALSTMAAERSPVKASDLLAELGDAPF